MNSYRKVNKVSNIRYFYISKEGLLIAIDQIERCFLVFNQSFNLLEKIEGNFEGIVEVNSQYILGYNLRGWDYKNNKRVDLFHDKFYVLHTDSFLISKMVNLKERVVDYFISFFSSGICDAQKINFPSYPILFRDNKFICMKGKIYIYDWINKTLILDADFSEIGSYTDMLGRFYKGEVKNVYLYKNKVIVLAGAAIVTFDLNTGEKLWQHTKTPTYWDMAINDHLGYLSTNAAWGILNLTTGDYEFKGKFPDIQYNGKNLWSTGGELTYHDNLLWLNVFTNGLSFLVAMNPQNGTYEWVEKVETTEAINPPKFHGNRMYLLDTGRTLHVYEKE
jgi:outer membrane protein assembly factor BamB